MPRMKRRDFERIKEIAARGGYTVDNELIRGLVAHAEAIDKELDQAALEYGKVEQNNDRLIENVAQLQRELNAVKPGPVEVSQAVADAFKYYKNQILESYELLYSADNVKVEATKNPDNKHAAALADLIFMKGLRGYYTAVFYGYTVKKTKEERLKQGIADIYNEWDGSNHGDLFDLLTEYAIKFNAENK